MFPAWEKYEKTYMSKKITYPKHSKMWEAWVSKEIDKGVRNQTGLMVKINNIDQFKEFFLNRN